MNSSTCSAVICQPGGREQKHDIYFDFHYALRFPNILVVFSNVNNDELKYSFSLFSVQNPWQMKIQTCFIPWV